jgi:hypothetical protein
MVALSEVHSLLVGDKFSWSESGPLLEVEDVGYPDYDGELPPLVLYRDGTRLYGHTSDHTRVWVLVV